MDPFPEFKMLFAIKLNFNGGQFCWEISKCGYFKILTNQNKAGKKMFDNFIEHLGLKLINDKNFIYNASTIKK